jgi:hypothetical protein
MTHYIFLRIAWMKYYKGVTENDIPSGAGWYVDIYRDGGEVYNFYPIGNYYYGYARIQDGRNLKIEKVGALKYAPNVENVTIILFAKNPDTGGQYIVGWYKHATLYREVQQLQNREFDSKSYLCKAKITDGYLLPVEDRIYEVVGPGQTNAWYPAEHKKSDFFYKLKAYIENPSAYIKNKRRHTDERRAWQPDIEKRKQIEIAAMSTVAEYFELRNYIVTYKHNEKLGWDLEAVLEKKTLQLEVKGLAGEFECIELTPNEYANCKRSSYRICVVSNALNEGNRKLDIFYYENGLWISKDNKIIAPKEIISARFTQK